MNKSVNNVIEKNESENRTHKYNLQKKESLQKDKI